MMWWPEKDRLVYSITPVYSVRPLVERLRRLEAWHNSFVCSFSAGWITSWWPIMTNHPGRWSQMVSTSFVRCKKLVHELTTQTDIWRVPLVGQYLLTLFQTPDITIWLKSDVVYGRLTIFFSIFPLIFFPYFFYI